MHLCMGNLGQAMDDKEILHSGFLDEVNLRLR